MNNNNILQFLLLLVISVSTFSCQDDDNDTPPDSADQKCEEVSFELKEGEGLDITVEAPLEPLEKGYTYKWDITLTKNNGEPDTDEDANNGDNIFRWGVDAGTYDFCLTTTSEECSEGKTVCKKLVVTEKQVEEANASDVEKVIVVKTDDGNYTLEIVKNEKCTEVIFELKEGEGLDITVEAPLEPLNLGYTYRWDITLTQSSGESNTSEDANSGDNIFRWGVGTGTYDFCLTTTSENCPEGKKVCKKLVVTDEQVEEANAADVDKIIVIKTDDGNYTLKVIKKEAV